MRREYQQGESQPKLVYWILQTFDEVNFKPGLVDWDATMTEQREMELSREEGEIRHSAR